MEQDLGSWQSMGFGSHSSYLLPIALSDHSGINPGQRRDTLTNLDYSSDDAGTGSSVHRSNHSAVSLMSGHSMISTYSMDLSNGKMRL